MSDDEPEAKNEKTIRRSSLFSSFSIHLKRITGPGKPIQRAWARNTDEENLERNENSTSGGSENSIRSSPGGVMKRLSSHHMLRKHSTTAILKTFEKLTQDEKVSQFNSFVMKYDHRSMKFCLKNGHDITIKDRYGRCPLMYTAMSNNMETLNLLTKMRKEDLQKLWDGVDMHGMNLLHWACRATLIDEVFLDRLVHDLIAAGAQNALNQEDDHGVVPLVYAFGANNSKAAANRLLRAGADPGAANRDGRTPLDWVAAGRAGEERRVRQGPGLAALLRQFLARNRHLQEDNEHAGNFTADEGKEETENGGSDTSFTAAPSPPKENGSSRESSHHDEGMSMSTLQKRPATPVLLAFSPPSVAADKGGN